jgi:hypothetical protein
MSLANTRGYLGDIAGKKTLRTTEMCVTVAGVF